MLFRSEGLRKADEADPDLRAQRTDAHLEVDGDGRVDARDGDVRDVDGDGRVDTQRVDPTRNPRSTR